MANWLTDLAQKGASVASKVAPVKAVAQAAKTTVAAAKKPAAPTWIQPVKDVAEKAATVGKDVVFVRGVKEKLAAHEELPQADKARYIEMAKTVAPQISNRQEQLVSAKIYSESDLYDTLYQKRGATDYIKDNSPTNLFDITAKYQQAREGRFGAEQEYQTMAPEQKQKLALETVTRITEEKKKAYAEQETKAFEQGVEKIIREKLGVASWFTNTNTVKAIYENMNQKQKQEIVDEIAKERDKYAFMESIDKGIVAGLEQALGRDEMVRLEAQVKKSEAASKPWLSLGTGMLSGATFGISDVLAGKAKEIKQSMEPDTGGYEPSTRAMYAENKGVELATDVASGVAYFAGLLGGGFLPYSKVAQGVQDVFAQVPGRLGKILNSNPILSTYIFRNVGEEIVEGTVRTSTGQEYGFQDFMIGVAMGAAFEGTISALRMRQVEKAVVKAEEIKQAPLTPEEFQNVVSPLPFNDRQSFGDVFGEKRLVFYKGGKQGRAGIDYPAEPPKPDKMDFGKDKQTLEEVLQAEKTDVGLLAQKLVSKVEGKDRTGLQTALDAIIDPAKSTEIKTKAIQLVKEAGYHEIANLLKSLDDGKPVVRLTDALKWRLLKGPEATPPIKTEAAESEAGQLIRQELAASIPGERFRTEEGDISGYSSTFPQWIPEDLRKISLINKVEEHLQAGTVPKFKKQLELYNVVKSKIESEYAGSERLPTASEAEALADAGWDSMPEVKQATEVLGELSPQVQKRAAADYDIEQASKKYMDKLNSLKKIDSKSWASDLYHKMASSKYLRKFGDEGKEISKKIEVSDRTSDRWVGEKLENDLAPKMKKMSKEDMEAFTNLALGKPAPDASVKAQKMFESWDNIRKDIVAKAKEFGLMVTGPDGVKRPFQERANYLPKVVKAEELDKILNSTVRRTQLARRMVESGAFKTIDEADASLTRYITDRKSGKFGSLEYSRVEGLPDELYETDPRKTIPAYVEGAYRRLADAQQFGGEDQILDKIIKSYGKKGGDVMQLREVFETMAGLKKYNNSVTQISRIARTYQNITKLSLAAVGNISDIISSITAYGGINTLKAAFKNFTPSGKEFNQKAGVTKQNVETVFREAGETELGATFMKWTGFSWTERNLRGIASIAGSNYAQQLFKKLLKKPGNSFLIRRLEQFGVDVGAALKKGELGQDDLADIGWQAVKRLQPVGRQELPFYWQNPGVKIMTQFKSFAYKRGQFVIDEIGKEALQGNFAPLLRYAVLGLIIGEEVGDLKATVRGRAREGVGLNEAIASGDITKYLSLDNWERIVDGYMTVGGVGLASDFMSNLLNSGPLSSPFLSFLAGPTFGELSELSNAIVSDAKGALAGEEFVFGEPDMGKGEKQSQILKSLTRKIPILGSFVTSQVFPSKQTYKARTGSLSDDLFNLVTGAEPEKKFEFGSKSDKKFDFTTSSDKKFGFGTKSDKKFNF